MSTPAAGGGNDLAIKVIPRASRDEVQDLVNGELRIRLRAPPVDGEANRALLKFLGRQLGIPPSSLQLVRGQTGRHKCVRIPGLTRHQAEAALLSSSPPRS